MKEMLDEAVGKVEGKDRENGKLLGELDKALF